MKIRQHISIAKFCPIIFLAILLLAGNATLASSQIDIVGPAGSGTFGSAVTVLPNGNIVIVDTGFDAPGPIADVGAVYLYDGRTGALISVITGSTASDNIGSSTTGITVLPNSNFLIRSANWDNGAVVNAGAITFCSGTTGCSGVVSTENSLVGSTASDGVGSSGVMVLENGNAVVRSPNWDSGPVANVGAITFCDNTTGCPVGPITATNSLIGSTASDTLGSSGFTNLPNGNYIVNSSSSWDNGAVVNAGAITFCSGTTGCTGVVSASNSLVGSTTGDGIGTITVLSNGNFVVSSSNWDNGASANVGSATFCSGTTGCTGAVSASNSLIGATTGDASSGTSVTALANGNYVFRLPSWDNGAVVDAGSTTWCDGTTGCLPGVITSSNSLVGTSAGDGSSILISPTANSNYVVTRSSWDDGATTNVGAATFCSGTSACTGAISAANSLTGSTSGDQVGNGGILALANGNYVVRSTTWNNGAVTSAGAATFCDGATGCTGTVTNTNSLVGSTASDNVGQFGAVLANGNYIVRSPNWDNGAITNAGAVTWCIGTTGCSGAVSEANSLVGSSASDAVGSGNVFLLPNGNYVVGSSGWDNGAIADAGAATWCSGASGCTGPVSESNSLVGSTASDLVSQQSILIVGGSNYVVRSTGWDNGAITNAGAVTWCNGATGCQGPITTSNSLVGATAADGIGTVTLLTNGNYLVSSSLTDNGAITDAGSLTWGNGSSGTVGLVSLTNSLMGSTASDQIGSSAVTALPNGNYLARSSNFDNPTGPLTQSGAITYGAGNGGTVGLLSSENSVLGTVASGGTSIVGSLDAFNETFVVGRPGSNTVTILNPTFNAVANGTWSSAATWNYGSFTRAHDGVIPNGRTVSLDVIVAPNSLFIDCTGALTGANATAYIKGSVRKDFCAAGSFNYPVGTDNGYSPVNVGVTVVGTAPSGLTVAANQSVLTGLSASNSLKRFWSLTESGTLTANLTFTYLDPTDVSGLESTYELFRTIDGVPSAVTPFSFSPASNTVSVSAVSDFSDWSLGNLYPSSRDGDADATFNNNGRAKIDFDGNPTPGAADQDFGYDVAIQPDGKIVVSGETYISTTDSVFSAVRLNADGTVDTTFANDGKFTYNAAVGINERAYGIAVQPDGKIIIAGRTNSPRDRVILRLNGDGTLDSSFATGGVFRTDVGSPTFDEQEIAIQPDGKIIVIGTTKKGLTSDAFSVMRLNVDGTFDATFDGDGEAVTIFSANDRAYGVTLQADGKIVVSGSTDNNGAMAVARYNTDGSLDSTFDGDGRLVIAFAGSTSLAQNVLVQPDNKIVLAGYFRTFQSDAVLVRINPNGSLDTSFSGDGAASFGTTSNENLWDLHWRNGKIIGTGFRSLTDPSTVEDFMLVRFNGDGSLDTQFGTNGVIYTDFNTTRDVCLSSAMQADGKLVLAGYSSTVNPLNPDFAVARYDFTSQETPYDFDGDGKSDLSIVRPIQGGTSQWWIRNSSNGATATSEWGLETDVPTSADFDGDGRSDIAVWRPASATNAKFFILNSSTNTLREEAFGQTGDKPIAADYDGDGKADLAVFREGAQSTFFYRGSRNNPNGNTTYIQWGTSGDKPVVGDFNGDGKSDFAVFRNGDWWILQNGSFSHETHNWGLSGDLIVPGDYDGDGKTDLAVFRPTDGIWYIRNSSNDSVTYRSWGTPTDVPVPGDYDGDSKTDPAVYRDGTWWIWQSSNSSAKADNFGLTTDTPVPSTNVAH